MDLRLFIDSDVIISSLLSTSGAAFFLLNKSPIKAIITTISLRELQIVMKRMNINEKKLQSLIKKRLEVVNLTQSLVKIKKEYSKFVTDENDAHIVAGSHHAKVKYLITYNLKHFNADKINKELDVLIMTPAIFMQFLRTHYLP
jgi:predicted nucleic acid-binding protein